MASMADSFIYRVAVDDLIAFNLHVLESSGTLKSAIRNGQLAAGLASVVVTILVIGVGTGSSVAGVLVGAIVGAITLAVYPGFARALSKKATIRQVQEFYAANTARGNVGEHELSVGEEGIVESTEANRTHYQWIAVDHVEVTQTHVMIFVGPGLALLIPFAAGSADREQLLEALKRHAASTEIRTA